MAPQPLTKSLLVATAAGAATVLLYVSVQKIRRAIKRVRVRLLDVALIVLYMCLNAVVARG